MSDPVVARDRSRFSGPTPRSSIIPRVRLDDLYRAATGQVLCVMAPAGYGKSTQVLRWVLDDGRRVRWLDLEPIDNDPLVLGHTIVQALADSSWNDRDLDDERFDSVAHLVATLDEPFVLVLDDVHHVVSDEAAELIGLVIDHLPAHSTLVLVGRSQPLWASIAAHRLAPGVIDVTARDLAFDLAETEEMLTTLGLDPDIDAIATIAEQLEGWPAGLRLAGQVLATRRSGIEVPLHRLGDLAYVTEYVTQEWFGSLDQADQVFLTELGCLERFSGAQCDAVLGRRNSAATLRRLCHDELMLIGLDQHDEWFRLHAVLSRWLSARLRSSDPDRWCAIHVAAARWWSVHGDIDLAIGHAAAADDSELLETLVLAHCGRYAARGMYRTLERWLDHFSDAHVLDSLPLKQVQAVLNIGFGDGERALGWTRLCRSDLVDGSRSAFDDVLVTRTDALLATLENRPARELIPLARDAHRRLPKGEWRALASLALGANLYLCGEEGAIELLRESLFETEAAGATTLQATTAATLAIVLDLEGSRDDAAALSDRATRLLATPQGRDASATAVSLAIASLVDARAGRHDDAASRRDAGLAKLAGFDRSSPWFGILGLVPLIRTSLLLDDAHGALDLLHQLESKMKIQEPGTPLARHVATLGDAVRVANAVFAARSWTLTAAELRVVQYLPTNLSLAEIATRLYVSRNTVKSHAAAIYRKLGTTSRTEAVELAQSAGLIGDTSSAH